MNLNELFNESENPFQSVIDKIAAKEKQTDAEHTQGLKDIEDRAAKRDQASREKWSKDLRKGMKPVAESEYGIPDETPGHLPGGPKMTFGEFKKMWPGVILKRPSGGSLAGSVVADVEGWMNNPKSVWEPLKSMSEGLENYNGIQLSLEIQKDGEFVDDDDTDNQTIFVQATANGRELGQVVFAIDYDDKGMILVPQDLEVDERFRSQGIAATMYDYVKSKGYRIHRSSDQTPAGAGFWDKHKPGKDIWEQGVAEGEFEPINDDDYYEYNIKTNKIVKHISGKHPIASKFNPLQREWPGRDADHKIVKGLRAKYLKDDVVDEKVSDFIPDPLINKHSIVKGWRKAKGLDEKAPPGDKAERMVKHIKQGYAKDGKLTDKEKSIAYATAWKAHNAGKV